MRRILAFLSISCFAATPLARRIDAVIHTSQAASAGFAGIQVVQLRTGRVLYTKDAHRLFIPASNTKLFSTSLALMRLGPDYRLNTRVYASGAPDANGGLAGDLVLYGGGDPTMSDRRIPYLKNSPPADALAAIEEFADRVVAQGIRSIDGNVVGDDSAYVWEPYPPAWAEGDAVGSDGAPVSALDLDHNSFSLTIAPGAQAADPAVLTLTPAIEYFAIDNRVATGPAGSQSMVRAERPENSRELRIRGTVALDNTGIAHQLAVDDPALYAAAAFYDALTRRGVRIRGRAVAHHRAVGQPAESPAGIVIAERQSPPLSDILQLTDKISANLWAELMLREVGRARRNDGSRKGGLDELAAFLSEIGIDKKEFDFTDGSGLSRNVLVSPAAVVQLLAYMDRSGVRTVWHGLLPVGGEDGTLANRFHGSPEASAIHAKTGSLSHVNALSGYAKSRTYGEVAFSILVNNTIAPAAEVRDFIDKIGLTLLQ